VASLLTGTYSFVHGIRSIFGLKLNPTVPTLVETLRTAGYYTIAEVSGPLFPETGLDRGFDVYHFREGSAYLSTAWGADLRQRLQSTEFRSPWFLFLHLWELHHHRHILPAFRHRTYGRNRYERALSSLDSELATLIAALPQNTLIVIHVSASTRFKRWPEDSFVSLVVALVQQDGSRRVFLTSGPSDVEAARRITDAARRNLGSLGSALLESRTFPLADLRALIVRAALFIGGDSGPLHIAATTSVPIVELLGPTLAERSFPWRDPSCFSEIIDPGDLPCRPCHQRTCVPGDFRCLTGTRPERVIAAAERALRSTHRLVASATNARKIPVVH